MQEVRTMTYECEVMREKVTGFKHLSSILKSATIRKEEDVKYEQHIQN